MSNERKKHHSGGLSGQHDEIFKGEHAVLAVLHRCLCCRLGLTNGKSAYVVPMTFTYEGYDIYIHSHPPNPRGGSGKKNEYIKYMQDHGIDVCVEFDVIGPLSPGIGKNKDIGCSWSLTFASVIGYGPIVEIRERDQKVLAMSRQLVRYTGRDWPIADKDINSTVVWKISLDKKKTTPHYHLITPPKLS